MKNTVSLTIPKPGIAKWGNFNHTTLVQAELFRGNSNDNVAVKTVEGMVRSAHDLNPIAGISIRLMGTNVEAVTDHNGWFSITIEKPTPSDVLILTSTEYKTLHVLVDHEDFLHINLKQAEVVKVKRSPKRWTLSALLFW